MRDRLVNLAAGGQLFAGGDAGARAWLELTTPAGATTRLELEEGELLMAVEALAMVYGELCGARPDSLARGVNRTLRNRTRTAREGRRNATGRKAA